jgi:hypothetical protein
MRLRGGFWRVLAVVALLGVVPGVLATGTARAGAVVVLPRPGQVGVSLSGGYGTLLQAGNVGDLFGSGPGLEFRVRYRARYERGFGLTFESHGLDARMLDSLPDLFVPGNPRLAANDPSAYKRLNLFLYGVDVYQMFGTRTKTTKMVSLGVGLAHPIFALNDGENEFVFSDGAYLSAGVGIERFFWQSVAFDLGARYHAIFLDGKLNHDLQASAGLIFYASL